MKCGECSKEAFISITENKDKDPNQELTVYYFCADCYVNYQTNNAN